MKDLVVEFIDDYNEVDFDLTYVVIPSRYKNKWVFGRHKSRTTWEVPGGHIENGESSLDAARRELYEEAGAVDFTLEPVCIYNVKVNGTNSYGVLYYADIKKLNDTLEFEIAEITMMDNMPSNLTYPDIQPLLYEKVKDYLRLK